MIKRFERIRISCLYREVLIGKAHVDEQEEVGLNNCAGSSGV